jgi:FdhE protein
VKGPAPVTEPAAGDRPDCAPWLALLALAFDPGVADDFAGMVAADAPSAADDRAPLLAGATLVVDAAALRRYVTRLLSTATRAAGASARGSVDETGALALLEAAVAQDGAAVARVAEGAGLDAGVLSAVAPVAAMPLLQAHRQRWERHVSPAWARAVCPVCGAWPGLAEMRGLDRAKRFRCLRCAGDWRAEWLACPYCDNRRHAELGALVPAGSPETRRAETCARCRGYLKSLATLQASPAVRLGQLDAETLELDVAAVAHGYRRPEGPGHPLGARVEARRPRWGFRWPR